MVVLGLGVVLELEYYIDIIELLYLELQATADNYFAQFLYGFFISIEL